MPNYSKTVMIGHLTRDPELKYLPSGTVLCKGGIAETQKWKDKDGKPKEDTCFLDWQFFGKRAESFEKYHKKGDCVLLEGRLRWESWETKDGQKRSKNVLDVKEFAFMPKRDGQQEAAPVEEAEEIPF